MSTLRLAAVLLALLVAVTTFADDTPTVKSATLCRSVAGPADAMRPVDARDRFPADEPEIHALVRLEPVTAACRVRGAWIAVDAINVPNHEISGTEIAVAAAEAATVHFSISRPANGWPVGNYHLLVSIGDRVLATTPFAVEAAAAPPRTTLPGTRPGTTVRHAAGFAYWMPAGWTATDQDGSTRLVPPDVDGGPDAPTEMYVLAVASLTGMQVRRPDDAQIVEYLDGQVRGLSTALTRVGEVDGLATAIGPGASLTWEAKGRTGERVSARAFTTLVGENCATFLGIGKAASIAKREADLKAMFVSMSRGEPKAPADAAPATAAPPPAAADDAAVRRKLDALEKARAAGVLSDEEYAAKRAELMPAAPPLDDAARSKLAALEAARAAGVLSEDEFAAQRAEILRGRPAPGAAPGAAAAPSADAAARLRRDLPADEGKTWRHPVGFSLWYPARWTLTEHPNLLQLTPPDPATSAEGPTEIYVVCGETVAGTGITDAADARVVAYMDQQMQALAPFLARQGEPKAAATDVGRGVVMDWQGANPRGDKILARARVTIVKEYAVALIALGHAAPIGKREAELTRMFSSFRLGEGRRDPQLAGSWSYLSSQAMSNPSQYESAWSRANMTSDNSTTFVAAADGTWTRTSRHHMIAGAGGTWIESNDVKVHRGTWYADAGRLTLVGDDGAWEDYDYRLQQTGGGVRLLLVRGGTGELWTRQ